MDKERVKLIIKNMELLLESLKAEVSSENSFNKTKRFESRIDDYDEVFDEYDD